MNFSSFFHHTKTLHKLQISQIKIRTGQYPKQPNQFSLPTQTPTRHEIFPTTVCLRQRATNLAQRTVHTA